MRRCCSLAAARPPHPCTRTASTTAAGGTSSSRSQVPAHSPEPRMASPMIHPRSTATAAWTRDDWPGAMLALVKGDTSKPGEMNAAPYRVAPPQPPDPYLLAWTDLRRRRIAERVSGASSLLGCAFASRLPIQLVCLVLVVMAAALAATFRHTAFPCPRCSEFFSHWLRSAESSRDRTALATISRSRGHHQRFVPRPYPPRARRRDDPTRARRCKGRRQACLRATNRSPQSLALGHGKRMSRAPMRSHP
jgi:hypothetical protein